MSQLRYHRNRPAQDKGSASGFWLQSGGNTHRFTAPLQQEQPVEAFEQERRRLVDCAQDGLSMICQLPQEPDNIPRALSIETRGRFVKEEK